MGAASGAGAGLELVGTIMQMVAAQKEAQAMQDSVENELRRQGRFRSELQPYMVQDIAAHSPEAFAANRDAGAAQSKADYAAASSVPASVAAYAPEDNPILRASADQQASNARMLDAASQLQGYKRGTLAQNLAGLQFARTAAPITNYAKGWESLLPLQLRADSTSQQDLMAIGQLTAAMGGAGANMAAVYGNNNQPKTNAAQFQPVTGDYGAGYGSQFSNVA